MSDDEGILSSYAAHCKMELVQEKSTYEDW